ncbi:TadE/TadG family type IV pilus assembly protein [Aquamicrobium sp. LC103]|uniref:TadE/TadG family type IV pilus assembly protein n=1 Tax=Aquamicrobium sp. LC103 TaxID=1120658 RepID=UPI00063EB652|nr:TadE/TadG family type IV pilus assembly protein [Aquamicrobium sp. LC103]TKT74952.1 pilus assembly protein [Aquamicrobium sp. LC103]
MDTGKAQKRRIDFLDRFRRDRKGSVAIEFAALAIPFSLLVFAILESCISFAAQQTMSNVTDDVARQFRTGQLKAADMTETRLRDIICGRLEIMVSQGCPGLEIDLRTYDTFADAARQRIAFTSARDIDTEDFRVEPGQSMSKNMLRVFYRWPVMTDFLRKSMSNLKDGKTLLFATVTWQNEPFDD